MLLKDSHLQMSAKSNSLKDFKFSYNDSIQEVLIAGYEQNTDFFTLLLNNDDYKNRLMHVFLEDVYKKLRKED